MSKTVDERVVEMRFDNKQFEQNVQTSMSTLDKLKKSLNLTGAAKGLDNISSSAQKCDLSVLSNAAETVKVKFSALEVMAVTALSNITNSAVNAGKRIVSALTIDPIKSGFQEYETQINAVQTILANTSSKGTTLDQVNNALDELNHYADMTIYNFTEMTKNIGTFTAAGVDLDTSVAAIKGIANLAAVSGSTSTQASTAMYQLSQALAAGSVKLMDWNSVVNAGMGGEVFQDALKETARVHGIAIDQMIEDEGSFRETLSSGWLSSDILTETLAKFTGDLNEDQLRTIGYTEEQIQSIMKMGQTANDAATKVKTFTQLFDTLKEAAQSGWTQSWEIIVGDFEEAKALLTEVSDTFSGLINASADARNSVLQEWKDLGGRTALIETLQNAFESIVNVVKPVKEAFQEVFPPLTGEQLYKFTAGLEKLSEKFKITEESGEKIKRTFKGIFSVFGIGTDAIKAVVKGFASLIGAAKGFDGSILSVTASIGDWLTKISESIRGANIFEKAITKIIDGISKLGEKISSVFLGAKAKIFANFGSAFSDGIVSLASQIGKSFGALSDSVGNVIDDGNIFKLINGALSSGILLSINMMINKISNSFGNTLKQIKTSAKGVTKILKSVKESIESYQRDLQAKTLMKIAIAIGLLAASIKVLSTIDSDALARSLAAMGVMAGELMASLFVFNKITTKVKGAFTAIAVMNAISFSILILASALKKISSIDTDGIIRGLVAIGVLMAEMSIFMRTAKVEQGLGKAATSMLLIAVAMNVLAKAVEKFGSMSWEEIYKGLASIAGLLAEVALFDYATSDSSKMLSSATSLILISTAMNIMTAAFSKMGNMSWDEIGRGLVGMGGALAEVVIALRLIPKDTFSVVMGLPLIAKALVILATAMISFGGMSWNEIAHGLTAMGGALAEIAIGLNCMKGTLSGAAALTVAAIALSAIAVVMKSLGKMSWSGVAKGLIAIAGAFTVIGVAGALLSSVIWVILGLGTAFALLGVGMVGIGAGLVLIGSGLASIAVGFTALAAAGVAGATSFVSSLSIIIMGVVQLIPSIAIGLAEGVVAFIKALSESAVEIASSILTMILGVLDALATYAPQIVDALFKFIVGILQSLRTYIPQLIEVGVGLLGDVFTGIIEAIKNIGASGLLKGIAGIGMLTALMYALSGVVSLIPTAMAGVIGMGLVVTELSLVLAGIGALSRIPGLNQFIEDGGNLLQNVGTAIGKFVGGIAGGFMSGMSSQFPAIGTDLSAFMENLQPFIEGASSINPSTLTGVEELVKVILALTAANIIDSLTRWLTGGSSLSKFAEELVPFGEGMKDYSDSVSDINVDNIEGSAKAAMALVKVGKNLENSGGLVSLFTGDNKLDKFGEQLVKFGEGMKSYAESVAGIDAVSILISAQAALALVKVGNSLENSGGLVSVFAGDNTLTKLGRQLVPFGEGMKSYSEAVRGLDTKTVLSSVLAAQALVKLSDSIVNNTGGLVSLFVGDNSLGKIGKQLIPFGEGMRSYAEAVKGLDTESVKRSASAAKAIVDVANNIQNGSGGLKSFITGDISLSGFGDQLYWFGSAMKSYAESVAGIDTASITNSASAAQAIVDVANSIENGSAGITSLVTGNTSLSSFGSQLSLFGSGMQSYAESVADLNVESITNSAGAAQVMVDLANALDVSSGGLKSFFTGDTSLSGFADQLVPFGDGMKEYSESVDGLNTESITGSVSAAKAIIEVANSIQNGSAGLKSLFTGDNSLSGLGSQLYWFGSSLKTYSESVTDLETEPIINSTDAARALIELANGIESGSGGWKAFVNGDTSLSALGNQLAPFGEGMKDYSESVDGLETENITASVAAAKAIIEVANSINNGSGGLKSLLNGNTSLAGFADQLQPFAEGMKEYSDSVSDLDGESITASISSVSNMVSMLKKLEGVDPSGAESFKSAINTLGETSIDKFIEAFDVSAPNLTATGAKMMTTLITGIKSKQEAVGTSGKTVASTFLKALKAYYSKFTDAGKTCMTKFVKGLKEKKSSVKSAATSGLSSAVSGIRSYYSQFYSAGSYLVTGFAKGISDNTYKASAKAKAMAKAASDAAKKQLNEHSPSKVGYQIGDYFGVAFVNAISDYSDKAYSASADMAKSATSGLGNAVRKIQDLIDTGMNASPTIRPVVDLSNVEAGAGKINGMFGSGIVLSVGRNTSANLNAINSSRRSKIQNATNDDVVYAINKLRGDIGNINNNSYTINGVTYDDGSNISNAVEAIVRAARIDRRS